MLLLKLIGGTPEPLVDKLTHYEAVTLIGIAVLMVVLVTLKKAKEKAH